MSKRIRLILPLLCICLLSLFALVFTACEKQFTTEEDVINQGYVIAVKFDFQGGRADESGEKLLRVKENSYVPRPGTGALSAPARTGYTLKEYGVAETDDEGNIVYENESPKIKRVWDFNTDRATENITLCAIWWKNFTLNLHYTNDNKTGEDKNEVKVVDVPRNSAGLPTQVASSSANIRGFTVLGYYLNENKTGDTISFPYTFSEFSDENMEIDIWCDNLTGTFQVVRNVDEFLNFSFISGTNVYLMCDIDMKEIYDAKKEFSFPSTYSGKFWASDGGHKISNLVIEKAQESNRDSNFGIFNILDNGAEIKDITFDNVTYTAKLTNTATVEFNVGLFAGRIRDNVVLSNVTVSGTLNYSVASNIDESKIHMHASGYAGTESGNVVKDNCNFDNITANKTVA